jgi:Spy/CpxP family protein refolding chaperone
MKTALIVIAVFVLGAVTGGAVVLATRAAPVATQRPGRLSPDQRAELLTKRLDLTPAQRAQVVTALQAHVARMRSARAALVESVAAILDDRQRERFDALTGGGR